MAEQQQYPQDVKQSEAPNPQQLPQDDEPSVKKRKPDYFEIGKVFWANLPEPDGRASSSCVSRVEQDRTYAKWRLYVVVSAGGRSCTLLGFFSYGEQGVTPPNKAAEHGIVHTSTNCPEPTSQETMLGLAGDNLLKAIKVNCDTKPGMLNDFSRINYGKSYNLENYVKVRHFGIVDIADRDLLCDQYRLTHDRRRRRPSNKAAMGLNRSIALPDRSDFPRAKIEKTTQDDQVSGYITYVVTLPPRTSLSKQMRSPSSDSSRAGSVTESRKVEIKVSPEMRDRIFRLLAKLKGPEADLEALFVRYIMKKASRGQSTIQPDTSLESVRTTVSSDGESFNEAAKAVNNLVDRTRSKEPELSVAEAQYKAIQAIWNDQMKRKT